MIERTNRELIGPYRLSYVSYNGSDDERCFVVMKDKELPSWVKCDSDVIGIMRYLQINGYDFENRDVISLQITPYDVCRALKDDIEKCWDLDNDYKDFLKSRLKKFKSHTLTLDDVFLDAYLYEVSGYIGYYTCPNGDVVDINLEKWEEDMENPKIQNI